MKKCKGWEGAGRQDGMWEKNTETQIWVTPWPETQEQKGTIVEYMNDGKGQFIAKQWIF